MLILMNNIQKSVILTGFIISFIMIIFSTPKNNIFAVEYDTYTSESLNIEFQFPSNWKLDDEDNQQIVLKDPNDSSIMITITKDPFNRGKGEYRLQSFTDEILEITKEYPSIKIIQNSIPISTENLEMQTFLITDEDKDNNNEIMPFQYWTFIADGYQYEIIFEQSSLSKFNSPENTELINHFIKSVKFRGDGQSSSSSSTSRFD